MRHRWTIGKRIYGLAGFLALGLAGICTVAVLGTNSLHSACAAADKAAAELMGANPPPGAARAPGLAAEVQSTRLLLLGAGGLSLLIGLGASGFLVRRTNLGLGAVVNSVAAGAQQMAGASGQVSAASQSLAAGASAQSSSLEATRASLAALASMTQRNADHASKAGELSRLASQAADRGLTDLQVLSQTMQGIKDSSDQVAKIMKIMKEFACQANLLAFNVAVEATRAGKAGPGLAVVAAALRALAQSSASAAEETADKMEIARQRTNQGLQLSARVRQDWVEIAGQIQQVAQLAAKVSGASCEQCRGLDQVQTAVRQMAQVTRSNVARAASSAGAAAELTTRAEAMGAAMNELQQWAGGSQEARGQRPEGRRRKAKAPVPTPALGAGLPRPAKSNGGHPQIDIDGDAFAT